MEDDWIWQSQGYASPEEEKLRSRIYGFGEYFSDMLFETGSCAGELIKCQSKANGNWQDDAVHRPDELTCFSYSYFKTKVEQLENRGGYFNGKEQILCVSTENLENDGVILHEMIHLHEFVLNELPLFYHDTLLWSLYIEVRKRITNLDEIISSHAHILNGQSIYDKGGLHDILFLLKSLELDMRMGYQLGTVFGYDAKELFKNYVYQM